MIKSSIHISSEDLLKEKLSIAILIACFNRKEKTLSCLQNLFAQAGPCFNFTTYLIDNGSDGTSEDVRHCFPGVRLVCGDKDLFWAGSMRTIWQIAIDSKIDYDYFLLLNDDTVLTHSALNDLLDDVKKLDNKEVILIGATLDPHTNKYSYGGNLLTNRYGSTTRKVIPNNIYPQLCHLGNGNVMFVSKYVVEKIGILSNLYTHGIADYDYTMRASKAGIQSFVASRYSGFCINDHGDNWRPARKYNLKQRLDHLYSVKGLAYKQYMVFLKLYFPFYLPQAWFMLWLKTLFPFFWEKLKKQKRGVL